MSNWEQIYDQHAPALRLYTRQWTHSMADAEDAVQDAFVRVFKSDRPDPERLLTCLYQAARWCALDLQRSRQRRVGRETGAHVGQPEASWFECSLEEAERQQEIQAHLQLLPEEQREVLVMKIWSDLTFQQIADILGESLNTIASRYRYALKALRRSMNTELMYGS